MKFGKRLTSEAARRWGSEYLDYKAIKRALKEDLRQGGECLLESWRFAGPPAAGWRRPPPRKKWLTRRPPGPPPARNPPPTKI